MTCDECSHRPTGPRPGQVLVEYEAHCTSGLLVIAEPTLTGHKPQYHLAPKNGVVCPLHSLGKCEPVAKTPCDGCRWHPKLDRMHTPQTIRKSCGKGHTVTIVLHGIQVPSSPKISILREYSPTCPDHEGQPTRFERILRANIL